MASHSGENASRALMRFKRESDLEELEARCKRLEQGDNFTDTVMNVAGGIATVAGALVMPGLGAIMGTVMWSTAAAKGLLGNSANEKDCADLPFKQLEQQMNNKFNEVNRKLDQQAQILKNISEKVIETLSKLEMTRQEMNAGFQRVLDSITSQDITNNAVTITSARDAVSSSEEVRSTANKEQYINIIIQEIEHHFLFNYVKPQGTLYEALYAIINKRYAVPKSIADQNAYSALAALNFGTLTYASIVFSLLDQYSYISEYYYQRNELEKFNHYLGKLTFYFTTFKRILGKSKGLIDKVIKLLNEAKIDHGLRNSKKDLYKSYERQIATLKDLKQKVSDLNLPVIETTPTNDIDISFNVVQSSSTNFLDWKKGSTVSYAVQFESGGKYSKISDWVSHEVGNKANPIIELRNSNSMNRLVFRKFDNAPPQLIRIVSGSQRTFRDVDRDLYNVVSKESYDNEQIVAAMDKLINMGANVKALFENERNVVHAAAAADRYYVVNKLVEKDGSLINLKDSIGYTPLHIATERKYVEVVEKLIHCGADVNAKSNTYNVTPLHLAVRHQSDSILKLLLAGRYINPNEGDSAGLTPLHLSVSDKSFSIDILDILLENPKVNPNVKDKNGLTPLHYATLLNSGDRIARLLQSKDIDKFPTDNNGMTPAHFAAMKGYYKLLPLLRKRSGEPISAVAGDRKWTPLHFAVYFQQETFAKEWIFFYGYINPVDVNAVDVDMQTPLHIAAASGQLAVMEALIYAWARVYLKTVKGHTPLDLAIIHGKKDAIEYLVKEEKKQKTEDGRPARDADTLACELAKGDILELLIHHDRCSRKFRRAALIDGVGGVRRMFRSALGSTSSNFNSSVNNVNRRDAYIRNTMAENGKAGNGINYNDNYIGKALKFLSHSSKPKESIKVRSSSGFKFADVNNALLLMDLLIRKFTNEKYNSEWVDSDSPLLARARALNITESLEKIMKSVGVGNDQEDVDLFDVHSKIYKAVLSGSKNKLVESLCSYLNDYSSLEPRNVEKFITAMLKSDPFANFRMKLPGNFQNLITHACTLN